MSLTLTEVKERMADRLDEITILELLEISSNDLVERFEDFIEDRYEKLEEQMSDDEG